VASIEGFNISNTLIRFISISRFLNVYYSIIHLPRHQISCYIYLILLLILLLKLNIINRQKINVVSETFVTSIYVKEIESEEKTKNPIGILYLSLSKTHIPERQKNTFFFFIVLTLIEFNINNETKQSRYIDALTNSLE
jgi:hypothetical protein